MLFSKGTMSRIILQRNKLVDPHVQAARTVDGIWLSPTIGYGQIRIFYLCAHARCAILKVHALPILLYYLFSSLPANPYCRLTSTMNGRQQNRQFTIFRWMWPLFHSHVRMIVWLKDRPYTRTGYTAGVNQDKR